MKYLYIKSEVKTNDTTAKTTAINKLVLVRGISLVREMGIFLLLGRILPPSTGFPPNSRFGGIGRALHIWWGQQAI